MNNVMAGGTPGQFDKDALADMMGEALSLDELKTYADADSVKSFYYTLQRMKQKEEYLNFPEVSSSE